MVLVAIASLIFSHLASAEPLESRESESLRALAGVFVVIEELKDDMKRDGSSVSQIQTDVELRLRQAGIKVLSRQEALASPGFPYLYVRVTTGKDRSTYAYGIQAQFNQLVQLERNPAIRLLATTCAAAGSTGMVGAKNLRDVRKFIAGQVDEFTNTYLAVNPKKRRLRADSVS